MSGTLYPIDESDLSDAVSGAIGPLQILGGGTRPIGRIIKAQKLSTEMLKGIVTYEPGALTMVAKSGTPIAEIQTELAAENQRLAFEPMDYRGLLDTDGAPTLGGVVAANVSGPRRIQVGAARDFTLGLSFVDGNGQLLKNGGRVMKNVTGYDLVKLMAGSWGTLGVLSEVALKVLPASETQTTLEIHVTSWEQAVGCMSAALRTPFDVSGAATQCDKYGKIGVLVRVEGFEASVVYRIEQLKAKLSEFGNITELSDPWLEVKNLNSWKPLNTVWRISVRPTDALKILELMRLLQKDRGFQCQLDWGGGLIWIGLNVEQANDVASCTQVHESLQVLVATLGGHANLIKSKILSNLDITHFQPLPRAVSIITKTLRQKFDPRGILNPQRMS